MPVCAPYLHEYGRCWDTFALQGQNDEYPSLLHMRSLACRQCQAQRDHLGVFFFQVSTRGNYHSTKMKPHTNEPENVARVARFQGDGQSLLRVPRILSSVSSDPESSMVPWSFQATVFTQPVWPCRRAASCRRFTRETRPITEFWKDELVLLLVLVLASSRRWSNGNMFMFAVR